MFMIAAYSQSLFGNSVSLFSQFNFDILIKFHSFFLFNTYLIVICKFNFKDFKIN